MKLPAWMIPVVQFQIWLDEAITADVDEPTAMLVSTVSPEGRPAARVVLLERCGKNGRFVFSPIMNRASGQHLAHTPFIALTFFWPGLERQVNIEGRVEKLPADASDAHFASRPYKSRVGAWASEQSRETAGRW